MANNREAGPHYCPVTGKDYCRLRPQVHAWVCQDCGRIVAYYSPQEKEAADAHGDDQEITLPDGTP